MTSPDTRIEPVTGERERLGLTPNLWRLAIVIGMAQFAMSIWTWRYAIFIEPILTGEYQMSLTFVAGTMAALIGYLASGMISDVIGRRKTMTVAFVPMILGLVLTFAIPVWPWLPFAYALISLGWSFILIISRAMPADIIAAEKSINPARKFTMVLMPAFFVDGVCPVTAGVLITLGLDPVYLMLFGAVGAMVAMAATPLVIKESLSVEIRTEAKQAGVVSIRGLGFNFWVLVAGMMPFYFTFGMAIQYLGPLCVNEWAVSDAVYGATWSAFSLTSVVVMHSASGIADRNKSRALLAAVVLNGVVYLLFSYGSGWLAMLLLNVFWAFPLMLWIGAERSLIVEGVGRERQGRALGTFQLLMSSTNLLAPVVGQAVYMASGSYRYLYGLSGVLNILTVTGVVAALRVRRPGATEGHP
ncbi:MAG: hypothetical protein HXY34_07560 [Candidatus Thorarchaeota archaeon]|nr:hypothetical protein [Candidatus Thorarchaeota archaeon]